MVTDTCTGDDAFAISDGVISSVIDGFSCVSISEKISSIDEGSKTNYAFKAGIDCVKTVDFSNAINLESIGSFAFFNCRKIQEIDLSNCAKLSSIGTCCFFYCTGMKSIKLPEVSLIKTLKSGCFSQTGLTSFIIPNSVINIEGVSSLNDGNDGVFANSESLSEITFQPVSKVESISSKAFLYTPITYINFPASLKLLTGETFRVCNELKEIKVEEGNGVFSSKNGVLLTNNGKRVFYYPNKAVDGETIQIPEGVTSIGQSAFIGDRYKYINLTGITEICSSAFDRQNYLVNVTIPATVTVLNPYVFYQCTSLKNVVFEGSYQALPNNLFQWCSALTVFTIPSGVFTIGDYVFYQCSNLITVYIPNTVTMIGTGAFSSCNANLQLIFESGSSISYTPDGYLYNSDRSKLIIYLGSNNSVVIISSVKTICNGAFKGKTITSVSYEAKENIDTIENEAFRGCSKLTTIELPPNIQVVSNSLFYDCTALKNISIPSKVTKIDDYAFRNCKNLSVITFDSQVKTVGAEAFYSCSSLKSMKLPENVTTIYRNAFSYSGLETFTVPESLKTIQEYAFSYSSLKRIEFPSYSEYQSIKRLSFSTCRQLEYVVFPGYVHHIYENAFASCTKLANVTIGENIVEIEENAFFDCTSLEKVIIGNNQLLESISSFSFEGCTSLKEFDVKNGENNFYFATGILFNKNQSEIIIFLRAAMERYIEIPSKVKAIRSYAFANCTSIETVYFDGQGIEKIAPFAFYCCKSLRSINFPPSLLTIGNGAFSGCGIKLLNIGEALNMTVLSDSVFANNKRLSQVILPVTIDRISSNAFEGSNNRVIIVYLGTKEIKNSVGFSSLSSVIATEQYPSNYFVGVRVTRDMNQLCTMKPKYIFGSSQLKQMTCVSLIIMNSI